MGQATGGGRGGRAPQVLLARDGGAARDARAKQAARVLKQRNRAGADSSTWHGYGSPPRYKPNPALVGLPATAE
ncbi:hypothetical protein GCM10010306_104400 [Streptomyces umbrinus]|nr:hypothetical protein GCM10010306_104400 [Streptomyces umbrinus]